MCFSSAALTLAGQYLLTNWRLKKLEESDEEKIRMIRDVRERMIRVETMLNNSRK